MLIFIGRLRISYYRQMINTVYNSILLSFYKVYSNRPYLDQNRYFGSNRFLVRTGFNWINSVILDRIGFIGPDRSYLDQIGYFGSDRLLWSRSAIIGFYGSNRRFSIEQSILLQTTHQNGHFSSKMFYCRQLLGFFNIEGVVKINGI